ncbi:MAG: IclR family transcriptional regulator [Ruegeria sp.]
MQVVPLEQKRVQANTLEKGLRLIEALADAPEGMSLTELGNASSYNIATVHRLATFLVSMGYIERRGADLKYFMTLKIYELGQKANRGRDIKDIALPILKELSRETGKTVYLMMRDKNCAVCLARVDSNTAIKVLVVDEGEKLDLHVGAGPRVLLANLNDGEIESLIKSSRLEARTENTITNRDVLREDLARVREQGYAVGMEDVVQDVASLGCPVRNAGGDVVAAISVSGLAIHFSEKDVPEILAQAKSCASRISEKLGNVEAGKPAGKVGAGNR